MHSVVNHGLLDRPGRFDVVRTGANLLIADVRSDSNCTAAMSGSAAGETVSHLGDVQATQMHIFIGKLTDHSQLKI